MKRSRLTEAMDKEQGKLLARRAEKAAAALRKFDDLFEILRKVGRGHGYAIAAHGSLARDIDIVAVPWVEDCATPAELIKGIVRNVQADGFIAASHPEPTRKPHGRLAWVIHLGETYLDISVMPPHPKRFTV